MDGRRCISGLIMVGLCAFGFAAPAQLMEGHQTSQDRPISLGTSGGNVLDRSALRCCGGTLGALVEDRYPDDEGDRYQYVLSNNHVLAKSNLASVGDPINQPGMIDQNCQQHGIVAELAAFETILFGKGRNFPANYMDAAIASALMVDDGAGKLVPAVDPLGSIIGIGTLSAKTVPPFFELLDGTGVVFNQWVQKSGRTTGLTTGMVAAVGVTVDVGYSTSCGGAANQVARFVNQFSITSTGGAFSDGGDSGSLIVEMRGDKWPRRAVGLLFAGNSTYTIASPIDPILDAFSVRMVGARASVSGNVTYGDPPSSISGADVSVYTGQSTTTDNNGDFVLSDVPVGTNTVTVQAEGFAPQSIDVYVQANGSVSLMQPGVQESKWESFELLAFALVPETAPELPRSLVQCVTYDLSKNSKNMFIAITVVDEAAVPVSGAQVAISVKRNGSAYASSGGTTGSDGKVTFTYPNAPAGTYVTEVTSVAKDGVQFEGSTPTNSYTKGSTPTPASFCRESAALTSSESSPSPGPPGRGQTGISRARAALEARSSALFNLPDVTGHGVGISTGQPVIEVYLINENARTRAQIPSEIEGVPVRVVVTGPFVAY